MLQGLEALRPDCVLIEGPADANSVLPLAAHEEMSPPVALLLYAVDDPQRAVFCPFAEFSPEWCALRWALAERREVRFFDLPQAHRLASDLADRADGGSCETPAPADADSTRPDPAIEALRFDPLGALARAAGFDDGERWWDSLIESRSEGHAVFPAIGEAMAALREQAGDATADGHAAVESLREAWMRRAVREARREFATVVAICGAWHTSALTDEQLAACKKQDDARLKGLPKVKTSATWVPWTYGHLAFTSGYGAGVASPGWYEHLWRRPANVLDRWMTRVARLLRAEGLDCSSAHVIEATRLATTLAAFRGRSLADLSDIADACRAVFCFDSDLAMQLIARKLLVGERLGRTPADLPLAPLQQDLQAAQRRLRLKPEALERTLDLDLRNETDLARSHLLHRLRLLGIEWGVPTSGPLGKGTFHELWRLRWDPMFIVHLIEQGRWGSTVATAATARVAQSAQEANDLTTLTAALHDVLLADLPEAVSALLDRLLAVVGSGADVALLMDAFPALAAVLRYGNVRQTDATMVERAIHGVLPRICVGLPLAVQSLNDEASEAMRARLAQVHDSVQLLESTSETEPWLAALERVADGLTAHGLVRGKAARLLFDARRWSLPDVSRRLSNVLSLGTDAAQGAAWIEGFFQGSGLVLVHHAALLGVVDGWLSSISAEVFQEQLPLLRRTFSTFSGAERRQLAERLRDPSSGPAATRDEDRGLDQQRAARVLPVLRLILGAAPEGSSR